MPMTMQTRLLRVLQERRVTPLGAGQGVDVDFALICATHCNLREQAQSGTFRSDLYYRINGLTVLLPALRERTDFQDLTQRLLRNLQPDLAVTVEPDLLERLSMYGWPGNLRQYVNVLRTATAMLDPHETCISSQHLPDDLVQDLKPPAPVSPSPRSLKFPVPDDSHNLGELSRLAIRQALDASRGNMSQAARRLGISRQTLYRKLSD
jgi:transcriptional regulator of acetoin/glycerol metabolism